MKILLKHGRVIDPAQALDAERDVLIEKGKIRRIDAQIKSGADISFDLKGKLVVPGLIDMHTHLREPGYEYKETVKSGSEAAVAGGFTSIACMPNTDPLNDNRSVTEFILKQAKLANITNVYPVAAITKGSLGESLTEFGDLKDAGAVAFSDDGKPVMNGAVMRKALEYACSFNIPVISHCEDLAISQNGLMHEGFVSTELGLRGIPSVAEEIMIARDVALAGYTSTPVHIAHVSTAGSVRIIGEAKKAGLKVTAETAPHYFTLTDEDLRDYDTNKKVNPPLRTRTDVLAIKEGIRKGIIDAVASDHAPQSSIEKDVEFEYAANGIIGLETSLALSLRLVEEGVVPLTRIIEMMTVNPARILNLKKGTIPPGSDADITVIDPEKKWTVNKSDLLSRSKNTPFHGWKLKGKAVLTIVGGEIKFSTLSRDK